MTKQLVEDTISFSTKNIKELLKSTYGGSVSLHWSIGNREIASIGYEIPADKSAVILSHTTNSGKICIIIVP